MVLLMWARLDWSWLSSFTNLRLCLGNWDDFALVPIGSCPPSGCPGSFPWWLAMFQEKVWKHMRSLEARLLIYTQSLCCILLAKESHKPSPGSMWRNRLCFFMAEAAVSHCKGKGYRKRQRMETILQSDTDISNPSKQKCFCMEFNLEWE